jgi:hypothetical protein
MISVLTASIISFLTAIIVAFLGHYFTAKRERRNELAEIRLKAYIDFINATTRLAVSRRLGVTTSELEDLAILNDAKAVICICGDKEVIQQLTKFWGQGGTLEKESELQSFKRLCFKVRESLGCDWKEIAPLEISKTLFKLEPSNFSFKNRTTKS